MPCFVPVGSGSISIGMVPAPNGVWRLHAEFVQLETTIKNLQDEAVAMLDLLTEEQLRQLCEMQGRDYDAEVAAVKTAWQDALRDHKSE